MNCSNHPDSPVLAKGLCKRCYNNQWYWTASPELRQERQSRKVRKKQTSEQRKASHNRSRYGIEPEEYEQLHEVQEHKCSVCKAEAKRLVMDHNHKTNKFRGLICDRCNYIAGSIEDEKYPLVLEYLRQHDTTDTNT